MVDSLKNISDSISVLTQYTVKDTIYVINLNSASEFFTILPILIAGIALLFTVFAILISWRALMANIQHQKLSIQPLLTTNEDFTFRDKEGIGIKIISCGLGPAIIQNFKLLWNGNEINDSNINIIYDLLDIHKVELGSITKDGIFEKDALKWILRIPYTELPLNKDKIIKANEILEIVKKNLSYTIVYTSIYREQNFAYTLKYPFINT